jgi:hypothetical protein
MVLWVITNFCDLSTIHGEATTLPDPLATTRLTLSLLILLIMGTFGRGTVSFRVRMVLIASEVLGLEPGVHGGRSGPAGPFPQPCVGRRVGGIEEDFLGSVASQLCQERKDGTPRFGS